MDAGADARRTARVSAAIRLGLLFLSVCATAVVSALVIGFEFVAARAVVLESAGLQPGWVDRLLVRLDSSLAMVVLCALAYPALAVAMGMSMAQGSAANTRGADYRLARFYEELSARSLSRLAEGAYSTLWPLVQRLSHQQSEQQYTRLLQSVGRRAALEVAGRIREAGGDLHRASELEALVGARRLRMDVAAEGRVLQPRTRYSATLRIGADVAAVTSAAQESGGGRDLALHLFGEGVQVVHSVLKLRLPDSGSSCEAETSFDTLDSGTWAIRVFVTRWGGAEILQTVLVKLDVGAMRATGSGEDLRAG